MNGGSRQRLAHVSWHFALDMVLFILAFMLGIYLRFLGDSTLVYTAQWTYYPSLIWGALVFASASYIFGLYAPQTQHQSLFTRALVILLNLGLAVLLMTAMFYLNYSSRVGRGVMAYSSIFAFLFILLHHVLILRQLASYRERVALVVTDAEDEKETQWFDSFWQGRLELVGLVCAPGYTPRAGVAALGTTAQLADLVRQHRIDRVLCTNRALDHPALCQEFCRLRYSGETVMPLMALCEEVHQLVPLELMSPAWLISASAAPHLLYIKKAKRGFDILVSLSLLLVLGLPLLLAMLAVRLTSPGPIFYRQVRTGRFGRPFTLLKLRSMRVDAEADGPRWAAANDDRVTPVGRFLRRYRIDEIPQLLNVLRGEMSFVGPRPERPEFIEELARQVPYYKERLMIQPGLTGWAQVRYPYGASVEDARRKLEYDLYYMKHMSLFLDCFILLDTVRIVLRGGLDESHKQAVPEYRVNRGAPASLSAPAPAPTGPPQ
ncbi:exopolysaccharide biosynthesis polyprenyl glycosylphosphotransferase [Fontisphaera persica]|uniref:exopolysaccharide biosynthesis polyprenyl glycosylphosphotransferase n=1 Tax=Fontisphaera persica TaxID=2974023 RepID=UPI0024BF856C|nr:exopolysaccharide biosynthesis polyprenyl glycosylphosphotransferase [Fontisphaera persica]WCJ58984.1 exopolysaccharide biosynthesis polyprenyl glycosylphosphotransferase [Fontisphaera persica]